MILHSPMKLELPTFVSLKCVWNHKKEEQTTRSNILEGSWKREKEVINVPFGANQLGWLALAYVPLESKKRADRCETAELGEYLEHRVSALSPPLSFWNRSQAFWFVLLEGDFKSFSAMISIFMVIVKYSLPLLCAFLLCRFFLIPISVCRILQA